MKITQVVFPCGRIGLELDDGRIYRYYYNGDVYGTQDALKEGVEVLKETHGMILNLKRLREVSIGAVLMAASPEYS